MALTKATLIDLNSNELILDLDADTSITADTDDTIHFKIGGSDEITITGTALSPAASDGNALGTAALEWADLFLADGAVISLGDDQDVTLTHVADTGVLLNSTRKIQFNDASQFIHGSSATVLSIGATDEIDLTATAVDLNGTLDVSGTLTQTGIATFAARPVFNASVTIQDDGSIGSASDPNAVTISSGGVVAVTATTASSSSTTGALTVAGGAGVAADLSVGDDLRLISDATVLSFGADSDVTVTHVADTGITLNGSRKIHFGDTASFVHQSSDGVLTIAGEATIDLNASTAVLVENDLKLNSDAAVLGFGVDNDVIVHNSDFSIYTDAISGFRVIPQIDSYPSQSVMDNMLSTIMQTGKLPDGNYSFTVDLYKENDTSIMDRVERSIEIYSPVFLELVTPGGILTDTTDTKIFSTYPVFQWVTDYCPDCEYGIRVCEFNPDQHSSLSEALDDVSNIPLSQSEEFYRIGNINSFQYPTSGVIDLQPSKYYVWQIQRSYQSSIGAEKSLSNIHVFSIIKELLDLFVKFRIFIMIYVLK